MIAILGAGPHGKQVAALQTGSHTILYDDSLKGYESVLTGATRYHWLIGAAWPSVRRAIAEKCADALTVESAYQRGFVKWPGAKIGNEVTIGEHCHLQWNSVVSHGCVLGDFVTICAGVVLSGEVVVEDDVFIGANSTIIHGGITLGRGSTLGAGAVVIDDVPAGATVAGSPAKVISRGKK